MTTPEDRKALVVEMRQGVRTWNSSLRMPLDAVGMLSNRDLDLLLTSALDALEAAGCTVVPNEATEEMARKFWNQASDSDVRAGINAAIAHSPYRRK